jgi:hypothetical protein
VKTVKRPDGKEMLVYYSLGNFRAYQGFSDDTMIGAEAEVIFEHTYDGVRIKASDLKKIESFVKK